MAKDNTFYFSHDYNSRSDVKIQKLIAKKGYLGYGLFWALIENLYNNANALPLDYDVIAFELRTDEDNIKSIINDFDLFIVNGDFFGSNSVQRRLDERDLKSKKARESANNRWNKNKENANALQTKSDSNAIKESKVKESKVKESKVKESKVNENKVNENNSIISEIKNFDKQQNQSDIIILDSEKENNQKEKVPSKRKSEKDEFIESFVLAGAFEDYADEYYKYRVKKKLSLSKLAYNKIINESFGLNINEVIELCISKDWKGFKIEWYNNLNNQTNEKSTTKDRGYDPLGIYN